MFEAIISSVDGTDQIASISRSRSLRPNTLPKKMGRLQHNSLGVRELG